MIWSMGIGAIWLLVFLLIISIGISLSSSPRKVLLWFAEYSVFVHALAGVSDGLAFNAQGRERRERALAIEGFLFVIALGVSAFTYLLVFLEKFGLGVHLARGPSSLSAVRDAAFAYVAWHTVDLVPVLQIPETLHWTPHRQFTGQANDWILLSLKVFIVVIVLKTVAKLWNPGSA
jgi:hypothetical protein